METTWKDMEKPGKSILGDEGKIEIINVTTTGWGGACASRARPPFGGFNPLLSFFVFFVIFVFYVIFFFCQIFVREEILANTAARSEFNREG